MSFRFASPWLLLLAIPVLGALAWRVRTRERAEPRLTLPDAARLAGETGTPWSRAERGLPLLRAASLALVVLALARPQAGERRENVSSLGVDIMVALDISGSMRCEDTRPRSRLDVARESVGRFVEGRPGDRLGLVAFGSLAATRCPLTLDHDMLLSFLEKVDYAPEGEEGTAMGMGLATAVERLRGSTAKSRVAVLVTDGRSNQGQIDPEAAAAAAQALKVRVYTVGVGSRGEVMCPQDTPFGRRYVPRAEDLDEDLLKKIAADTGGKYFRAADAEGMRDAFASIDALEKSELSSQVRIAYDERFEAALIPAGALLALELALALGRLRRIP